MYLSTYYLPTRVAIIFELWIFTSEGLDLVSNHDNISCEVSDQSDIFERCLKAICVQKGNTSTPKQTESNISTEQEAINSVTYSMKRALTFTKQGKLGQNWISAKFMS